MQSHTRQPALVALSAVCIGLVPVSALFGQALKLHHTIGGGHIASRVTYTAFSPHGKMLASGGGATVILWDLASRRASAAFEHPQVACLAFSPNGHTLASGGAPQGGATTDTRIKLWNVATGQGLSILKGHESGVACLSFSPDGKTLASGDPDGTVKLWDIATGSNRATFEGHHSQVSCLAFSSDGKSVASGSENTIAI